MEQNDMMEEVQTKNVGADNTIEESIIEEMETVKVEQTSGNSSEVEMENSTEVESEKSQKSTVDMVNTGNEEELYKKLKTDIMEEIRKYFDPILRERGALSEVLNQDETLPVEREDNLINRIIDESGW